MARVSPPGLGRWDGRSQTQVISGKETTRDLWAGLAKMFWDTTAVFTATSYSLA